MMSYSLYYKFERQYVEVLVTVFPLPLFWQRRVLLNSEFQKQQYWGDKKSSIHEE